MRRHFIDTGRVRHYSSFPLQHGPAQEPYSKPVLSNTVDWTITSMSDLYFYTPDLY